MRRKTTDLLATATRIAIATAILVGPVGAYAASMAERGPEQKSIGFVLMVTLQRAG